MTRSFLAKLLLFLVSALLVVGCYKTTIGGTDGGGGVDSGRDAGDAGDAGDTGLRRCGEDLCGMGETCCPGCSASEARCVAGGFGCPDILCPDVIRNCEDAETRGYPGAQCEGDFGCGYGDACCTTEIFCSGGVLEMNTMCAPGCGGEGAFFVIDTLAIAGEDPAGDPSVIAGMNLDGLVSRGMDPGGCFHVDFTSPPPDSERGVDNQLGPIFATVAGDLGTDYADLIASGELLLVLSSPEGPMGPFIELWLAQTADGAPPRLRRGTLRPDQEFVLIDQLGFFFREVGEERTRAMAEGLRLPIVPGVRVFTELFPGALYANFTPDGVTDGVIGGGIFLEDGVRALLDVVPGSFPPDVVRNVLEAQADLPGPEGECSAISAGWTFTAVPARVL